MIFDNKKYGGLYNWQTSANFLVLRIISFSVDSLTNFKHAPIGDDDANTAADDENKKLSPSTSPSPSSKYNFVYFVTYCTYAPLYIGGPIITYDNFIGYLRHPQQSENSVFYAFRWLLCFVLMEVYMYILLYTIYCSI